ncbi:MAG: hypothetical protein FGM14_08580, partial [Flavobacteriales bacterium]|nr:hypothetical protein [Flavobacteriales bacterium]
MSLYGQVFRKNTQEDSLVFVKKSTFNFSSRLILSFSLFLFLATVARSQNAMVAYNNQVYSICPGTILDLQFSQGSCALTTGDTYSISIDGGSSYQTIVAAGNPSYVTAWNAGTRTVTINTTTATGSIWVGLASCGCAPVQTLVYNLSPVPTVPNGSSTICSGQSYSYTPTSTPSGATYTWSAPSVLGITGTVSGTDANSFTSGTLVSTNGSATVVNYTVTPKLGSCNGAPFTVAVTVSPAPSAGTNGTLTVCAGTTPTNAQLFAALGGTPDAGGTWSNIGLVYTYTVTGTGGCSNATATVTVTEQAAPVAGTNGTLTVCAGTTPTNAQLFAALGG